MFAQQSARNKHISDLRIAVATSSNGKTKKMFAQRQNLMIWNCFSSDLKRFAWCSTDSAVALRIWSQINHSLMIREGIGARRRRIFLRILTGWKPFFLMISSIYDRNLIIFPCDLAPAAPQTLFFRSNHKDPTFWRSNHKVGGVLKTMLKLLRGVLMIWQAYGEWMPCDLFLSELVLDSCFFQKNKKSEEMDLQIQGAPLPILLHSRVLGNMLSEDVQGFIGKPTISKQIRFNLVSRH